MVNARKGQAFPLSAGSQPLESLQGTGRGRATAALYLPWIDSPFGPRLICTPSGG